ncbi:SGNH/GDSL hydrolase family protein [Sphingobacterium chuzhouense]|uniref:hypothetical protein n=1 Tax=Sphingobacterium chuzhouense TaxID=1742264 RepID=UPI001CC1FD8A|nr:hypothetical protein [Sphingobacterium chuzhouense]
MNKYIVIAVVFLLSVVLISFSYQKKTKIYLIGDSTVADYSLEDDYDSKRYPLVGWGQVFQTFFVTDSLKHVEHLLGKVDQVKIDNRAKGGRSCKRGGS